MIDRWRGRNPVLPPNQGLGDRGGVERQAENRFESVKEQKHVPVG